jgi:HlyD family secretion protein
MSPDQSVPQPAAIRAASALFEIEMGDPGRHSRAVLWSVCALFGVLLLWSLFAKLDIVAVAQGRLVPQTYVKIVQPAEAGIIRELLVEEGSVVKQGDVLVRLDPTLNAADSTAVSRELALERLQVRRIEAELSDKTMKREAGDDVLMFAQVEAQRVSHRQSFLDSIARETAGRQRALRELDASREVLGKLESTLPSYQRSADAYEKLAGEKLIGSLQADEHRREATEKARDLEAQRATAASLESTIAEIDQRQLQLRSSYASDLNQQRLQSVTTINRLQQQLGKLNYQEGLLELRAPQAGVVKELATTTLGAVVQPGTVILSLVPANEPLRAEVMIENKDIGFVTAGQPVRVKLAAFQFQKYGMLEGVVRTISADSSSASQNANSGAADRSRSGDLGFKALIELSDQHLRVKGLILPLAAGMQVSAEIIQGRRTVLEYLLSPVQQIASEAGKER